MMEWWNDGMMEEWKNGMMEWWNDGMVEDGIQPACLPAGGGRAVFVSSDFHK
ncbi:MAG: hypothetical protein AB9834_05555 [Lentimicrobium sp.]